MSGTDTVRRTGKSRSTPQTRMLLREIGITYRQFDYWCSAGFIPIESNGSGNFRTLTSDEERDLRMVADLVKAGVRPAFAARIVFDGDDAALALRETLAKLLHEPNKGGDQ